MKAIIGLAIPENAMLQIKLALTVSEARELRAQIGSKYPGWQFSLILEKAIAAAEQRFEATDEVPQ